MVLLGFIMDYVMIENVFVYDLYVVLICMIVLWNFFYVEFSDN